MPAPANRGQQVRGEVRYELTDHLGNVRSVITDRKLPTQNGGIVDYAPDVVSVQDYYPFGSLMPGRQYANASFSNDSYRFGFQGQEGDDEWNGNGNSYAFKYRIHDPRIGRFLSLDPLAPDYPHNSPYAFSENVVVNAVELEGLEKVDVVSGVPGDDSDHLSYEGAEAVAVLESYGICGATEDDCYGVFLNEDNSGVDTYSKVRTGDESSLEYLEANEHGSFVTTLTMDMNGIYRRDVSYPVAVGYELGVSGDAIAMGGISLGGFNGSVMFLGGEYQGYWYDYMGAEGMIKGPFAAGFAVSGDITGFIGFNTQGDDDPMKFLGEYIIITEIEVGAAWGLGWSGAASLVISNDYVVIAGSWSATAGLYEGYFTLGEGYGKTWTLEDSSNIKKTSERSWWDIVVNHYKHYTAPVLPINYATKLAKKLQK